MNIDNARVVVTGAAGGLGRVFVCELLRAGAWVAAGDTNAAGLRQLAAEARPISDRLVIAMLDVTDEASVASFIAEAVAKMGGLDALINSAGIARDGRLVSLEGGEVNRLPLAQWRKVIEINLTGSFLMAREVSAYWVKHGVRPAVIVQLSSLSRAGNPGQGNYAASKAGLDACTRTWALELADHGIRVAGVAPGVTESGFLQGFSPAALKKLADEIPLGRFANPREIWLAVKLIIECDYLTGRTLEIDGGAIMGHSP